MLIDSYDTRNIDGAVLSRYPIKDVRSHIDQFTVTGKRLFSRDCLEVQIMLPTNEALTLFVNHFKSKFIRRKANESDAKFKARRKADHLKRKWQAEEVKNYISKRFYGEHDQSLYAVIGDFNDTSESPWVDPLINYGRITDIIQRHRDKNDCWTYYWRSKNRVSQIDYILVSRALRDRIDTVINDDSNFIPHIERKGLGYRELNSQGEILPKMTNLNYFEDDAVTPIPANVTPSEKVSFRFTRYQEILNDNKANISDHCPVKIWF